MCRAMDDSPVPSGVQLCLPPRTCSILTLRPAHTRLLFNPALHPATHYRTQSRLTYRGMLHVRFAQSTALQLVTLPPTLVSLTHVSQGGCLARIVNQNQPSKRCKRCSFTSVPNTASAHVLNRAFNLAVQRLGQCTPCTHGTGTSGKPTLICEMLYSKKAKQKNSWRKPCTARVTKRK